MRRGSCVVTLVILLAFLTLLPGSRPAQATCTGDGPTVVLECLRSAYAQKDVVALDELIAPDYVYVWNSDGGPTELDRATALEGERGMFTSSTAGKLELSFEPTYDVAPGPEEGTWIIKNLVSTLHIQVTEEGNATPRDYRTTVQMTLSVRLVASPVPHYQICREEQSRHD